MSGKWTKQRVSCEECGASLMRRLYRPSDGAKIERFFCNTSCKGEWQIKHLRPISREDLRRLYVDEGKSANDIARIVRRNSKRVWEWLQEDGITTRPRGHVKGNWFSKGHTLCVGRSISDEHKEAIREARRRDGSKGLFRPDGSHVLKGRRGADHPRFRGGLTPERQSFYASDEWKAACREIWHRADAKCERCSLDHRSIDRTKSRFHVHHIISFQIRELRAEPSNLVLLCEKCHRFVHSRHNVNKEYLGETS